MKIVILLFYNMYVKHHNGHTHYLPGSPQSASCTNLRGWPAHEKGGKSS